MVIGERKRYICLIMAIILFFLGMSADVWDTDSFFAYPSTHTMVSSAFLEEELLYRSIYQSSESKEDGQLFSCRSVIIDYIHQKDSGE